MDTLNDRSAVEIQVEGETLLLLQGRAAFWERNKTLVLADIHFGKAATLRKHGMAVPEGDTATDLQRLSSLIEATSAKRLIVVGDLLHAAAGKSRALHDAMRDWRSAHASAQVVLVSGNHDRSSGRIPGDWQIDEAGERLNESPFCFVHDPSDVDNESDLLHICGHLHPAVSLPDGRLRSLKAPCFWLQKKVLTLPAFGMFTGTKAIRSASGDRVFAITHQSIVEIPQHLLHGRIRSR